MTPRMFDVVTFRGRHPKGERRRLTLEQLVALATTPHQAWSKETAVGFSPTAYRSEYTHTFTSSLTGEVKTFTVTAPAAWRSNAGVAALSAFVPDIDRGEPDWDRLVAAGHFVVAYTTWSHTPTDPHWRLIVPLAADVLAEEWPSAWEMGIRRFAPNADRSCGDVSRFYWLAAAKPLELERIEVRVFEGALWMPSGLTITPPAARTFTLGAADHGDASLPVGQSAWQFINEGVPYGTQRWRALSATRNLLAAGKSVAEAKELVWQGLERSPQEPGKPPWTREDAEAIVCDLAARDAPPVHELQRPARLDVLLRRAEARLARARDLSAQSRPRTYDITSLPQPRTYDIREAGRA